MNLKKQSISCLLILFSSLAQADYIRTGPATASVSGMVYGSTKYDLNWLENSKGERWELPTKFKNVDNYIIGKQGTNYCVMQVKSSYVWPLGTAVDAASNPNFYGTNKKNPAGPQKISPDNISFPCVKQ